jgi:hypothetical protein
MTGEFAAARQFNDGREDFRRRRHQSSIRETEPDNEFPGHREAYR